MKTRVIHIISAVLKLLSSIAVVSPAMGANENNIIWGILGFMASSTLKDILILIGDLVDDGKLNKSFTGKIPLIVIGLALSALLFIPGCSVTQDGRKELTPEARAALARISNVGISLTETYVTARLAEALRVRGEK